MTKTKTKKSVAEKTSFTFDELSKDAKQRACEKWVEGEMSFDWWQNLYEDAERIGLKITSFELDRGKYAEGEFTGDEWGVDCAKAILEEHGADCATFKRAAEFMAHYVLAAACCDPDGPSQAEDEDAAEQAEQFLKDILKCYADMLQSEYEYLSSYEAAEESIRANDYKFDEDGNMI